MKSEENVIKVPRLRPYTPIFNEIIQDERLRLPVRAVFMLMLSCPPGWDFTVRGMAKIAGVNKDTMAKMLRELMEVGYIERVDQTRSAEGKFLRGGFKVCLPSAYLPEEDEAETVSEKFGQEDAPCPNLPCPENPDEKINIINNYNTPEAPKGAARSRRHKKLPDWKPERFAKLWDYYPRGENKQGAIRAWDRLKPPDELIDEMARSLRTQMQSEAWRDGVGIPYLSTWLNNERWTDSEKRMPEIAAERGGWAADPEVIRNVG